MENVRSVSFTIAVKTDKGNHVKQGTSFEDLEDAIWALYEADLCPFAPDEDDLVEDGEDEDEDEAAALDDEYDHPDTPGDGLPANHEDT